MVPSAFPKERDHRDAELLARRGPDGRADADCDERPRNGRRRRVLGIVHHEAKSSRAKSDVFSEPTDGNFMQSPCTSFENKISIQAIFTLFLSTLFS